MKLLPKRPGHRDDDGDSTPDAVENAGKDRGDTVVRKRRRSETMASVIVKTTEGSVVALLRENKRFMFPDGRHAAVLLLKAEDIGGLSERNKRDKDKGKILQLINGDSIKVVASQGMIDDEVLGIIPESGTLDEMDEYNLLVKAPYTWGVVDLQEFGIDPAGAASFEQARNVERGDLEITDLVTVQGPSQHASAEPFTQANGDSTVVATADASVPEVVEQVQSEHEDAPEFGEAEQQASMLVQPAEAVEVLSEVADLVDDGPSDDDMEADLVDRGDYDGEDLGPIGPEDEDVEDEPEVLDDRVVEPEEMEQTIARRFKSSDLGLGVDVKPFMDYFSNTFVAPQLAIGDAQSDWLGEQVSQQCRLANDELRHEVESNYDAMYRRYVELVTMLIEQDIEKRVSLDNTDNFFGKWRHAIDENHQGSQAKFDELASARRREIMERFEVSAEEAAAAAAAHARVQYKERNAARYEREVTNAVNDIVRSANETTDDQLERLNERRRTESAKRLDHGISLILAKLGEDVRPLNEKVEVSKQAKIERIREFIDENRKDDLARSKALQEDLARNNKLAMMSEQHKAEVAAIVAANEERARQQAADLERIQAENKVEFEHQQALAAERARQDAETIENLRGELSIRADEVARADERADERHSQRMLAITQDAEVVKAKAADDMAQLDRDNKRSNRLLTLMGLLAFLVALTAGLLLGRSLLAPKAAAPAVVPVITSVPATPAPTITMTATPATHAPSAPATHAPSAPATSSPATALPSAKAPR